MYREDEVEAVLQKVEQLGMDLWQQKSDIYIRIQELIPDLGKIYENLIVQIKKYNITEITTDKLLEQLKKIVDGLEKKDVILLADTFNYEVYQAVKTYIDIIQIENEETYGNF